ALDRELLDENPIEGLRAVLRRRNRTKRGRAENEAGAKANPIATAEDFAKLLVAAEKLGGKVGVGALCAALAGLPPGERGDVDWDRPALHVKRSLSRGVHLGRTKSGRERLVLCARRLLQALRQEWLRQGRPESGAIARIDHANYRRRALPAMCKAAGIDAK